MKKILLLFSFLLLFAIPGATIGESGISPANELNPADGAAVDANTTHRLTTGNPHATDHDQLGGIAGSADGFHLSTASHTLIREAGSGKTGLITGTDWDTFNNKADVQTKIIDFPIIVAGDDAFPATYNSTNKSFVFIGTSTKSAVLGAILCENYENTASIAINLLVRCTTLAVASTVFTLDYKTCSVGTGAFHTIPWIRVATTTIAVQSTYGVQYLNNPLFVVGPGLVQNNGYLMLRISRIGEAVADTYGGNLLFLRSFATISSE